MTFTRSGAARSVAESKGAQLEHEGHFDCGLRPPLSVSVWFVLTILLACGGPKPSSEPYLRRHADAEDTLPCLAWPNRAITYKVGDAFFGAAAVHASFAAWQTAVSSCSDLTFTADAGSKNDVVHYTQRCATGMSDGCWEDSANILAVTSVTYSRSTGNLLEADIQLNGVDWTFSAVDSPVCPMNMPAMTCVATDVQNTVTHEIGHLLGLDHVARDDSTMSATAPQGELAKRVIDEGTKQGVCAIYPRGAVSPSCLP